MIHRHKNLPFDISPYRPNNSGLIKNEVKAIIPNAYSIQISSDLLAVALDAYPYQLVIASQLHHILLCSNLTYSGEVRGAVPDISKKSLYLDIDICLFDRERFTLNIHHDFFHILDFYAFNISKLNKAWSLIMPNFKYGSGGASMQNNHMAGMLTDNISGFITEYATSSPEEDRAEMFSHMIVNYKYVEMRTQQANAVFNMSGDERQLLGLEKRSGFLVQSVICILNFVD
jgi:hypothetical protein